MTDNLMTGITNPTNSFFHSKLFRTCLKLYPSIHSYQLSLSVTILSMKSY